MLQWARGPASQAQTDLIRKAFAERGVDAHALPSSCYGDDRCALIVGAEAAARNFSSWQDFQAAALKAQPYVLSFRQVTKIVDEVHEPREDAEPAVKEAKELARRFSNDQILRYAFDSLPGQDETSTSSPIYSLYAFALETDLRRQDDENILYAQKEIARHGGWPAPPAISEDMHQQLWALVQHGDHRPDLQFDALLAMQRHYANQALPRQYAFLYDRVMLKLTSKQRYGTQVTCTDGKRVALPLDGSAPTDELRKGIRLPPLDRYLQGFPDCSVAP